MSGIQRVFNYARANPVALYIGGGFILHTLRSFAVNAAYDQHFTKYDVERKRELEEFLANHQKQ
jgi:hypothetical protein